MPSHNPHMWNHTLSTGFCDHKLVPCIKLRPLACRRFHSHNVSITEIMVLCIFSVGTATRCCTTTCAWCSTCRATSTVRSSTTSIWPTSPSVPHAIRLLIHLMKSSAMLRRWARAPILGLCSHMTLNNNIIIIRCINLQWNFLWDILRLPSSRRAGQGLYVNLTLGQVWDVNQRPYALLHIGARRATHYATGPAMLLSWLAYLAR